MVAYHIDIVGVIGSSPVPPTTYIKDIEKGELFVCENEGQISAVFCFFIGNEPTHDKIFAEKRFSVLRNY